MGTEEMTATKNKCNVQRCHGACCYNVPIKKGYLTAYSKRIAHKVLYTEDFGDGFVLPHTDSDMMKNVCPFLNDQYRCNIYAQRPEVCRLFGTRSELSQYLRCGFLEGFDKHDIQVEQTTERNMNDVFNNIVLPMYRNKKI